MKYVTREAILNYASALQHFAKIAPDQQTADEINRSVLRLRNRYNESETKQKEEVFYAIRYNMASTEEEICEDTGFSKENVIRFLQALIVESRIRKVKPEGRRASGRAGTKFEYFATDSIIPSPK